MASMTKLMTSIAAMQLVEQGKISLDDDVSHLLPDLAAQEILTGFNDAGKPILKKRQNPIKLVNLLTHSAGIGYDAFDPVLMKYRAWQGRNINTGATISERFTFPLTYEPGTSWAYGCGIDWAGRVVEIVTGETLESYMKKNIWEPLGIQNITFWPEKDPEMMENLAGMTARHPDTGGLIDTKNIFLFERQDCMGGQGSFANLQDYIKILHSLLKDDGVLLKKETAAKMFQPQLTKQSKAGLKTMMSIPAVLSMFVGDFPDNVQYDWGIGGILVEGDTQGRRKKGTLIWSGLPNLLWVCFSQTTIYDRLADFDSSSIVRLDFAEFSAHRLSLLEI